MAFNSDQLAMLSIALLAVALLISGGILIVRELERGRRRTIIGRAIERQSPNTRGDGRQSADNAQSAQQPSNDEAPRASELPLHWLRNPVGRMFVAEEDKRLLDQCGFASARAQLAFLVVRVGLAFVLPVITYVLSDLGVIGGNTTIIMCIACILGFMLPKLVLSNIAHKRRERVANELPLFVDLLKLLQGVGLSLDQSLQIMADDFNHVLKVLGDELRIANRQYAQGRTREHSLQRLATLYDNENLAGLVALLIQVDRHGGAVQEPLNQFGTRMRESRRSELKGRIGKITVKMTAVMVVTLLPALVIVTAGPGFLAVIRALGGMTK